MIHSLGQELTDALFEVSSTIIKCERMQHKFAEGTSQHTLLKNRVKAMYISKRFLINRLSEIDMAPGDQPADSVSNTDSESMEPLHYTKEELTESLRPIISIIHKCEKAREKYQVGTSYYKRFNKIIKAMHLSKDLIENQISVMK